MIYMTAVHWIIVAIFLLIFILLSIFSAREHNPKTMAGMIFSSFLLVAFGLGFSLFALDKYTKKGKLVSVTQNRDMGKEVVRIRGKIKNIGKFNIGYCTLEVRMSNDTSSYGNRKKSYFTPSKSLGGLFGEKDIKSNLVTDDFTAVEDLEPGKSKSFVVTMDYPPHFVNPKYKYQIFCH